MPDGAPPPTGAYAQARRCLEIILDALAQLGARPEDVVRTRVYVTSADDWQEIGRAHGEVFGEIRPASAMLVITGLLDPPSSSRSKRTRSQRMTENRSKEGYLRR